MERSPANLRVRLRLAENLVTGLDEFEHEWDSFVRAMHEILELCEEEHRSLWDPQLDELLKGVEAIRLDLASRMQIVLPEFRDPLAKFVRTSVRANSDALWSLIGETSIVDGRMMVPIEDDGELRYQVSLKTFEINADEARGEITRRRRILKEDVSRLTIMLEEAERAKGEAHRLELEKSQAAKLSRLVWTRLRESPFGKIVWWFGEEPLRKVLPGLLVAGAAFVIPPIRHGIVALVQWVLSQFKLARTNE